MNANPYRTPAPVAQALNAVQHLKLKLVIAGLGILACVVLSRLNYPEAGMVAGIVSSLLYGVGILSAGESIGQGFAALGVSLPPILATMLNQVPIVAASDAAGPANQGSGPPLGQKGGG